MNEQAKIFLSDERGLTELDSFRSYHTFNFRNYFQQYKTAVNDLYVLNDDTLAGGKSINLEVEHDSLMLLLPVVGAVEYRDSTGNTNLVQPGQLQSILFPAGSSYTISNIFEDELINFLQLWIKIETALPIGQLQSFSFDLDKHKNLFQTCELSASHRFHIAKFSGRSEAQLIFENNVTAIFAFIIEGAIELQARLLHARDGLALWNCDKIEMEALSNDAIVFLLEL